MFVVYLMLFILFVAFSCLLICLLTCGFICTVSFGVCFDIDLFDLFMCTCFVYCVCRLACLFAFDFMCCLITLGTAGGLLLFTYFV